MYKGDGEINREFEVLFCKVKEVKAGVPVIIDTHCSLGRLYFIY